MLYIFLPAIVLHCHQFRDGEVGVLTQSQPDMTLRLSPISEPGMASGHKCELQDIRALNVPDRRHRLGVMFARAIGAPQVAPKPGRMERVEKDCGFNVLVDYAHTDDALRNALNMLRRITPGRVFVVFGCGGNRDRSKRPAMTKAVQEVADFAWATADNPRKESLASIFDDMRIGVEDPERIRFVEDRRHAISLALDKAIDGDCILIAGKGHEPFQEFFDTIVPFDDRRVARELIEIKRIKPNLS